MQNFCRSNWKVTMFGKFAFFFVTLWHGRSCQEMCIMMLLVDEKTTQRLYKYQFLVLTTIISKIQNRNPCENCQKYALKLFWNTSTWHVLKDLIFYVQWTTWHDRSQYGPKSVTNDYFFDLLHSSYMWLQIILSCGKHCRTLQTGTVSRLWLCGRSWRFEIHFGRNIVHFRTSYVCSNQLDV